MGFGAYSVQGRIFVVGDGGYGRDSEAQSVPSSQLIVRHVSARCAS